MVAEQERAPSLSARLRALDAWASRRVGPTTPRRLRHYALFLGFTSITLLVLGLLTGEFVGIVGSVCSGGQALVCGRLARKLFRQQQPDP